MFGWFRLSGCSVHSRRCTRRLYEKIMETEKKPQTERTLFYQDKLPNLPLPSLEVTCQRYLKSVVPFSNDEEFRKTEHVVDDFKNGIGKVLHKKLQTKASKTDNWIADWWEDAYAKYRGPLPVFSNTSGVTAFVEECMLSKDGSQVPRTAFFIYWFVKGYQELTHETWSVDRFKDDSPATMEQYYQIFCSGRRPGLEKDTLERYFKPVSGKVVTNGIRHMVVIYRKRFYKLVVLSKDFQALTPPEIERQLYKIKQIGDSKSEGPGVGALTALERPDWFHTQRHLLSLDAANAQIIDDIHSSICVVVLSNDSPETLTELLTEGLYKDCANRWYDKGLSFVYFKNGNGCNNVEHGQFDGGPLAVLSEYVFAEMISASCQWKGSSQLVHYEEPKELEFVIDNKIKTSITNATNSFEKYASDYTVLDVPFLGFGKTFLKANKMRPNSFVQVALQLAHQKMHGSCASCYETATTRKFKLARTETTRSCTIETTKFVEAMINKSVKNSEKLHLLRVACDGHEKIYKEATNGDGIDRHLYALKTIATEEGLPLPDIFIDPMWKKSGGDGSFTLSTSMSGYSASHGATIPMVTDGYGIFYNIQNDRMQFAVTTCLRSNKTNIDQMYSAIIGSLLEMHRLVLTSKL